MVEEFLNLVVDRLLPVLEPAVERAPAHRARVEVREDRGTVPRVGRCQGVAEDAQERARE